MNLIKKWWVYAMRPPCAMDLATRELETARKDFLTHQSNFEYYQALVTFDRQRIARLERYLSGKDA